MSGTGVRAVDPPLSPGTAGMSVDRAGTRPGGVLDTTPVRDVAATGSTGSGAGQRGEHSPDNRFNVASSASRRAHPGAEPAVTSPTPGTAPIRSEVGVCVVVELVNGHVVEHGQCVLGQHCQ